MRPISVLMKFAILALGLALAAMLVPKAHAIDLEPQHFVVGNQFGSWMMPVVTPPKGWQVDDDWTHQYERLVMFENGDRSRLKPIMYLRAHVTGDMPLEEYIQGAQEKWQQQVKGAKISPLPDIERAGKPPIKLFLYENPGAPDLAFEFTAFAKDVDSKDPKSVVYLQAVVSAPNRETLEAAKPALMELLGNL